MQTSTRTRDTGASFATRQRGHLPQLSISDESHHVTEAIGYLYDDDDADNDPRQSAHYANSQHYLGSQSQVKINGQSSREEVVGRRTPSISRKQLPYRDMSSDNAATRPNGLSRGPSVPNNSWDQRNHSSPSPPPGSRERSPSDTATSSFPLNDIDYESSPAGLAQELSNLQALRRMSMHVGATDDPDLPQINAAGMPNAPSADSSEDDSSRLFWVPARLHPELAPKEFKTFLDSKAEQIRRRSGELSAFTSPTSSRSSSLSIETGASGLRRKKSMLSRQIDSSVGYQDGADRLERKRSVSRREIPENNLQELENLVANTPALSRTSLDPSSEDDTGDVILPSVPGSSLKRSTRTTYRRGGSFKGRADRGTYAQRAARRAAGESPTSSRAGSPESSLPPIPPLPNLSIDVTNFAQTLKDPSIRESVAKASPTNFSRPATAAAGGGSGFQTPDSIYIQDDVRRGSTASMPEMRNQPPSARSPPSTTTSFDRKPVPQIVETPPPPDTSNLAAQPPRSSSMIPAPLQQPVRHPERVSSRDDQQRRAVSPQRPSLPPKGSVPSITPRVLAPAPSSMPPANRPSQSLEQPSPLPGNDTNTSNLSLIPTLTVDKRSDIKKKEETKKSSWSWRSGKEDGDKEKPEKPKAKILKPSQQHDNTRLDLLQTSIDGGGKGRESLVLDRDHLKLDEERKKESQRKSSGSDKSEKKEKEGFFSSIFGGKKSKGDKESSKKHRDRGLSPEPPYREMKPDIDYHWTRFSILEERAIYRMAHIKLANPRRALYSQVLLSNFMYSYLAKVQQMHPQMNLPTSAKQQRKQQQKEQPQPQSQQQPDEFTQYQRYQQQQAQQQPEPEQQYIAQQEAGNDVSGYEHEAGGSRPISRGSKTTMDGNGQSSYGNAVGGSNQYYHNNPQAQQQLHQQGSQSRGSQLDEDDDDMW